MADLGAIGVIASQSIELRAKRVSGIVRDANGNPARRLITLMVRNGRNVSDYRYSSPVTGYYNVHAWHGQDALEHVRIANAANENENDLIDRVFPA